MTVRTEPHNPAGLRGAGIGLRAPHYDEFLAGRPAVPWVEVHSENFFVDGGWPLEVLERVRRDYPVSLHGVGASLGSADPLCGSHLGRLRALVDRFRPALVSEHLCWCSVDGTFLNDLLPLPYTQEALDLIVSRIQQVQEQLRRPILIENVSSYLAFAGADYTEWEFLVAAARRSGCGILLDVNNVYVSAHNHGFDPAAFLEAVPRELVGEIHLAGHTEVAAGEATLLIDTHNAPVTQAVWALYEEALARFGPVPTLIEWDAELPPLATLLAEAARAGARLEVRQTKAKADVA